MRAKQNEIRRVRAEYYPKVAIDAHVSETELDVTIGGSKYFGDNQPTWGAFLNRQAFRSLTGFASSPQNGNGRG